jgi:hypothetical protein
MTYLSSLTDAEWEILEPLLLQILPQKKWLQLGRFAQRLSSLFNRLLALAFSGEVQE